LNINWSTAKRIAIKLISLCILVQVFCTSKIPGAARIGQSKLKKFKKYAILKQNKEVKKIKKNVHIDLCPV